jgi:hypothetical protein
MGGDDMKVNSRRNGSDTKTNYYLMEGDDYIVSYGDSQPTFTYPALHNGLCETYLPEIAETQFARIRQI